jgi:serine/threonine protein kinase
MPPSRRVNNYELLDEIGSGGMSRVYRARKTGTGEFFAVKVIRIEDVAADFERRLRREPEVQRGLGHENVVQLFDWFRLGDEFFLVMELVEGRSLSQMIHRETGPMPFQRAKGYLRQTLRAVEHLHALGIIHRDIKPGNILVRRDDAVKLADFGIAKFTWQQGQTKTQKGLGTPEYMSPEQARGKEIDHRTDIYSLGITFYEMLTGRKPFSRDEETPMAYVEVIQDILAKPLPDPRSYVPAIPSGVVRLLNKATAKDPNDRFQSAAEMLGALEVVDGDDFSAATVVLGGVPVAGIAEGPIPATEPPKSLPSRKKETSTESEAPQRRQPPAREERSRSSAVLWIVLVLMLLSVGGYFGYQWYQKSQLMQTGQLNNDAALAVSQQIARDYAGYSRDHNPWALATMYAERDVEYLRLKKATRKAILDDAEKFYAKLTRTDQFDVEVKRARALNDSTIDTEWIITYQRMSEDGTLLRGTTSNQMQLERIDDTWLITHQRQNWIKRNNVAPPPDTPMVVDVPADTAAEQPQPSTQSQREIVGNFVAMIDGGHADVAWDRFVSSKLRTSEDRGRFLELFADQSIKLLSVEADGDRTIATVEQKKTDGSTAQYRMVFAFIDQNGPKIDALDITTVNK